MKTFRKFIGTVCAVAAAASCMAPFTASAEVTPAGANIARMGDADNNLLVNADDANIVLCTYLDGILNDEDIQTTEENAALDTTLDGVINADDANTVLSYYLKDMMGEKPLWADLREVSYVEQVPLSDSPFALKDFYVEVGCAEGAPGEQVTIPVYIAGADALAGFQYFMQPEGLEIDSIQCKLDNTKVSIIDKNGSTEYFTGDATPDDDYSICLANTEAGVIVWINSDGCNTTFKDGTIIAEYTYTIPEDAKSGDIIRLNPMNDPDKYCKFACWEQSEFHEEQVDLEAYQYTFLGGVVAVK